MVRKCADFLANATLPRLLASVKIAVTFVRRGGKGSPVSQVGHVGS